MGNFRTSKNKDIDVDALPWFKDGQRFECQRCGRFCRGEPGVVWVNKEERKKYLHFWLLRRKYLLGTIYGVLMDDLVCWNIEMGTVLCTIMGVGFMM